MNAPLAVNLGRAAGRAFAATTDRAPPRGERGAAPFADLVDEAAAQPAPATPAPAPAPHHERPSAKREETEPTDLAVVLVAAPEPLPPLAGPALDAMAASPPLVAGPPGTTLAPPPGPAVAGQDLPVGPPPEGESFAPLPEPEPAVDPVFSMPAERISRSAAAGTAIAKGSEAMHQTAPAESRRSGTPAGAHPPGWVAGPVAGPASRWLAPATDSDSSEPASAPTPVAPAPTRELQTSPVRPVGATSTVLSEVAGKPPASASPVTPGSTPSLPAAPTAGQPVPTPATAFRPALPVAGEGPAEAAAPAATRARPQTASASAPEPVGAGAAAATLSTPPSVAAPAPAAAASAPAVERVAAQLVEQVVTLRRLGADSLEVTLKPGRGLELALNLTVRQGVVEVVARVEHGSAGVLQQHWDDLQARLAPQGIRLAPLAGPATGPVTVPSHTDFAGGGSSDPHSRQDWRTAPDSLDELPLVGSTTEPVRQHFRQPTRAQRRGWDTWA